MPVKILGVDPINYEPADQQAYDTAQQWLWRITDLFITERSHQRQIGISEVGSDCRKCVARKLAQVYKKPEGSWYPFIGTAVHDALEKGFASRWPEQYHLENRLQVHEYKGLVLGGSCDMAAIAPNGVIIVNDWKVVGKTALNDAAKGKIKEQYRIQAMLYGLGWKIKGEEVSHVALTFLPRDEKLEQAQVVMLRFDEQVARDALAKLDTLIDLAEIVGWDKVIERQDKASFCFDCKKYEQDDNDVSSLI